MKWLNVRYTDCFLLTECGSLYRKDDLEIKLEKAPQPIKDVEVDAESLSFFALGENGDVYAYGENTDGQF